MRCFVGILTSAETTNETSLVTLILPITVLGRITSYINSDSVLRKKVLRFGSPYFFYFIISVLYNTTLLKVERGSCEE